jgi:ABC-type transport system involved in cytochrome c biogenesis permease subunit
MDSRRDRLEIIYDYPFFSTSTAKKQILRNFFLNFPNFFVFVDPLDNIDTLLISHPKLAVLSTRRNLKSRSVAWLTLYIETMFIIMIYCSFFVFFSTDIFKKLCYYSNIIRKIKFSLNL